MRRFWTEDELDRLKEEWGEVPVEDIARHLDRSVNAVHCKAGQLRLGRARPADVYSLNELLSVIGEVGNHNKFVNRKHGVFTLGLLKAERHRVWGRDRVEWWIREADIVTFLREYPEYVDRDKVEPPFRQYVTERYITLIEAFYRGAAFPNHLEAAIKTGLLPEAKNHAVKGSKWVIPESILPKLVEGRKRFVSNEKHRSLVRSYRLAQERNNVKKRILGMKRRYSQAAIEGRRDTAA